MIIHNILKRGTFALKTVRYLSTEMKKTIDFGFQQVQVEAKAGLVKELFNRSAKYYDVLNDVISLGVHRGWKRELARNLGSLEPRVVYDSSNNPTLKKLDLIDVCGGTGDISFQILNLAKKTRYFRNTGDFPMNVKLVDMNVEMMKVGKSRAIERGFTESVMKWEEGNAEALKEKDSSYDFYTVAFGIRNVTDRKKALREAYRVLRPGGRIFCLEMSKVQLPIFREVYDWYSFKLVPAMGDMFAKDKETYKYLVESVKMFPNQEQFREMILEAGFKKCTYQNLSAGIVALHQAWKD